MRRSQYVEVVDGTSLYRRKKKNTNLERIRLFLILDHIEETGEGEEHAVEREGVSISLRRRRKRTTHFFPSSAIKVPQVLQRTLHGKCRPIFLSWLYKDHSISTGTGGTPRELNRDERLVEGEVLQRRRIKLDHVLLEQDRPLTRRSVHYLASSARKEEVSALREEKLRRKKRIRTCNGSRRTRRVPS